MKNMAASRIRDTWSRTLGKVEHGGQTVLITRNGRAAAVLVPPGALELLHALEDAVDLRTAQAAMTRRRGARRRSWGEVKRRYGIR